MTFPMQYLRAYGKGYAAGSRKAWPLHKPPEPPNMLVAALINAVRELRDVCDAFVATICDDDEFAVLANPKIDAVDDVLAEFSTWVQAIEPQPRVKDAQWLETRRTIARRASKRQYDKKRAAILEKHRNDYAAKRAAEGRPYRPRIVGASPTLPSEKTP